MRCPLHGGLSTGRKTRKGRARIGSSAAETVGGISCGHLNMRFRPDQGSFAVRRFVGGQRSSRERRAARRRWLRLRSRFPIRPSTSRWPRTGGTRVGVVFQGLLPALGRYRNPPPTPYQQRAPSCRSVLDKDLRVGIKHRAQRLRTISTVKDPVHDHEFLALFELRLEFSAGRDQRRPLRHVASMGYPLAGEAERWAKDDQAPRRPLGWSSHPRSPLAGASVASGVAARGASGQLGGYLRMPPRIRRSALPPSGLRLRLGIAPRGCRTSSGAPRRHSNRRRAQPWRTR
jgi:hypothetical protein